MLSRMTNTLTCEISPQRISISQRNSLLSRIELEPGGLLETTLVTQLQPFCCWLPWFYNIRFILDAGLVNHLVVPWQKGISTPDELRDYGIALTQNAIPHLMGKSFRLGFEDIAYGHNALALVIEEEQWQTLSLVANQLKLRFPGVNTPLRSLLSTWRGTLPEEGIFALPGESDSTFACRSRGEWQHVYRLSFPGIQTEQQLTLVARLAGLRNTPCYF